LDAADPEDATIDLVDIDTTNSEQMGEQGEATAGDATIFGS